MRRASSNRARAAFIEGLSAHRAEIEEATLTRVYGVADPTETADPQYLDGLRMAVSAAIDYGFAAVEGEAEQLPPIPTALLVQARLAARNRISLDTVVRRYHGGNTLFSELLIEEAERCELPREDLKGLLRILSSSFDRLLVAVSEEHRRENEAQGEIGEGRRVAVIERLLAGELVGGGELNYEFDRHHLGVVAVGDGGGAAILKLGESFDRRVLLAEPGEEIAWAWLGGRREFEEEELDLLSEANWPEKVALARGEPGEGLAGWRLTHRQAAAALPVARRGEEKVVRYADVAILASVLQDDLLATSLRRLYLAPLAEERNEGAIAKKTLRAYFAAAGNASSAAAALGVSRRTIANRLEAIGERLGRPVEDASVELETVLRLEELS
jgi:hypothetical protein